MTQKVLEKGSKIAEELDTNGDNIISDLELKERMMRIDDENSKRDQERYLVWFSALTVTAFIVVLMTPLVDEDK